MRHGSLLAASAALLMTVAPQALAATLSGTVTSAKEGAMEGVIVSARKDGSTITVSVVSNEKGVYQFPNGRLEPGKYGIKIRAVGYDLEGPASVDIGAANAKADIKLVPTKDLSAQLTSSEWMLSAPGDDKLKKDTYACMSCHSIERVLKSKHTAQEFPAVFDRMSSYAAPTFPLQIQLRLAPRRPFPNAPVPAPRAAGERELGESTATGHDLGHLATFLASVNLSKGDKHTYAFKTFPRPSGRGTRVIYTEYDLPRKTMQPHDVILDASGTVWWGNFGENSIGKLDAKTGKVTEYKYDRVRMDSANGNLDIEIDSEGMIWIAKMVQGGVSRFNPKTNEFQHFTLNGQMANEPLQTAMVAPYAWQVDGKVWMNDVENRTFTRLDVKSGKYEDLWKPYKNRPMGERHSVYGLYADSKNNAVFLDFSNAYIGMADAKTGAITLYPTPTTNSRPRRGRVVNDVLWFAEWRADKLGMFDTKTKEMKEWDLPGKYTGPYDVTPDKNAELWSGNDQDDFITRLDTKTGKAVQYLMPEEVNVRRTYVDNTTARPTFWVGSNHDASIYKVEPLD